MIRKYADFPIKYAVKTKFKTKYYSEKQYKGHVSLLTIVEPATNIQKEENFEKYNIPNGFKNCKWLEFYPENSNVALTVGYDNENRIFDYYFDIINDMGVENGNPYIEDLYLDVLMLPDGSLELLDEDELKQALLEGDITKEQYDLAYKTVADLIEKIEGKVQEIKIFANKYFEEINLIDVITDEDIGEKTIPVEKYRQRYGARGIIIKENGEIAVFNKVSKNEYKLPGGGMEDGEEIAEVFKREVYEETGCNIEIVDFLGTIKEVKTQDKFTQMSYIFVGKVVEDTKHLHLTKEEETEGSRILWQFPPKALELITNCFYKLLPSPCEENSLSIYHTKFMVKRDKKILEYFLKNIEK